MSGVPVVVFAYNRPEKLRRVLRALRAERPARLIVYVDGPRSKQDEHGVGACRALAKAVDWADAELHLSETNQGVASLKQKIDAVFAQYPAAIFLEDDCLPSKGFYRFMGAALEHYQDHPQVFSIGGYQHLPAGEFRDYPYSLVSGARFVGWGWAAWQSKWRLAWPLIETYQELFDGLQRIPEAAGSDLGPAARRMAAGQGIDNWDVRVALAALALKQVHLTPARGLVRTIGQDVSGMHGSVSNALRGRFLHNRNVAESAPEQIVWLEDVAVNCDYACGVRDFVHRSQTMALGKRLRRGYSALRRRMRRYPDRLLGVNLAEPGRERLAKRALLAYIVHPFFISEEDERFHRHVNIWHAREMVRTLNGMGYLVDVVDYRDADYTPQGSYDLFIGHGGINFMRLASRLPTTPKIYFSTGAYWRFHNKQEQRRFDDLRQRRGVSLPPDRMIRHPEEDALNAAQAIIGIGNEHTRQTYHDWRRVWMIPGTAKFDDTFDYCPVDLAAGREHFLFFASGGNVHKGLDLVLEAFSKLEQHVWIMAPLDPAFRRAYRGELFERPNIHTVGTVQPRSRLYYRTLRRCAWCLLPSCSEGQAQSVVEAMNAGLVPLVSRAAGVDVDDFGEWIEPVTVEEIRRVATRAAGIAPGELTRRSRRAQEAARSIYAPEAFSRNFREALERALAADTGDEGKM